MVILDDDSTELNNSTGPNPKPKLFQLLSEYKIVRKSHFNELEVFNSFMKEGSLNKY